MVRKCSRSGCNRFLSQARLRRGLNTCAIHGRRLKRGNPTLNRPERRLCSQLGCCRRLSNDRIQLDIDKCLRHGGPVPGRQSASLGRRALAFSQFVQKSSHLAAPSLQAAPWGPLSRDRPAEQQLLNIVVLRRTGLQPQDLGWLTDWRPAELLILLCDKALEGQLVLPPQHCGATRNAVISAARSVDVVALGEHLSKAVIEPISALWRRRFLLLQLARGPLWFPLLACLTSIHGHAPFWANIVAFDMRVQRLATSSPKDRQVCCGFGPGGLRGLNYVLGRRPKATLDQRVAMLWAKHLSDNITWLPPRPEAYLVQWWLCEFSQVSASDES